MHKREKFGVMFTKCWGFDLVLLHRAGDGFMKFLYWTEMPITMGKIAVVLF